MRGMTQSTEYYARVLHELGIPLSDVEAAGEMVCTVPEILKVLTCPAVSMKEKSAVTDRVFRENVKNFMKVLCRHCRIGQFPDIAAAYGEYEARLQKSVRAQLYYVTAPQAMQLEGMRNFIKKRYHAEHVDFEMVEDTSLIGGFILKVKDYEYDYSLKGRFNRLEQKLTRR